MRYHYKKPEVMKDHPGVRYSCNHPAYNTCTLFLLRGRGLAVIQQRFNPASKTTYWSEIDPWIAGDLYSSPNFDWYFEKRAKPKSVNGLYPTATVRQAMHSLGLKPLPKKAWETVFDRTDI